jgi:cell division protein FtsZ
MSENLETEAATGNPAEGPVIKLIGIGQAGAAVLERLACGCIPSSALLVVDIAARPPGAAALEMLALEPQAAPHGLNSGGDADRARALAEGQSARLATACAGAAAVFIVAGLGGGAGTGISPIIARVAKEAGALALAFVTTPFDLEGSGRQRLAQQGLEALREAADGIICLPSQKVLKLIDESTSVLETFQRTNEMLADCVQGIWRLLARKGLLEIHFGELCELIRAGHTESTFAVAEAAGATRSREVVEKLLAHPLLDGGQILAESDAVLVSIVGGQDLTMADINRVMEQINAKCEGAQVRLGAAMDETFSERLAVTLIAARRSEERSAAEVAPRRHPEELPSQLLSRSSEARPGSRFVPPAPALPPEKLEQMLTRPGARAPRGRKANPKLRQTQLPLEIVSKGRFDKSEPTIHKGEDLDVPTYIRRGVSLN